MALWLVTVKLPKGHAGPHDGANKVTGACPLPPHLTCTDRTGEHHTVLWEAADVVEIRRLADEQGLHLTRAELCDLLPAQAAQSTTVSQSGVCG